MHCSFLHHTYCVLQDFDNAPLVFTISLLHRLISPPQSAESLIIESFLKPRLKTSRFILPIYRFSSPTSKMSQETGSTTVPAPERECYVCKRILAGWIFIPFRKNCTETGHCISCHMMRIFLLCTEDPPKFARISGKHQNIDEVQKDMEETLRGHVAHNRAKCDVPEDAEEVLLARLRASAAVTARASKAEPHTGPSRQGTGSFHGGMIGLLERWRGLMLWQPPTGTLDRLQKRRHDLKWVNNLAA